MSNFGFAGHGFSLKALLEDPSLQTAPSINNGGLNVKKLGKQGGHMPNASSAFLGSNLWDKQTGDNESVFDLEYMDLDEFLSENGIPVNLEENDEAETISLLASALAKTPPRSPPTDSSEIRITPQSPIRDTCMKDIPKDKSNVGVFLPESPMSKQTMSPMSLSPVASPRAHEPHSAIERYLLDDSFGVQVPPVSKKVSVVTLEEAFGSQSNSSPSKRKASFTDSYEDDQVASIPVYMQNRHSNHVSEYASQSLDIWEASPSPNSNIDRCDSPDLELVSDLPGQENFDPTSRKFSEEELKPQPIIKKSRKVFVDDNNKDDRYWQRRKKNNIAAKRSRDARRVKENQIAMRASFLESQNDNLRDKLDQALMENEALKKRLAKYEKM